MATFSPRRRQRAALVGFVLLALAILFTFSHRISAVRGSDWATVSPFHQPFSSSSPSGLSYGKATDPSQDETASLLLPAEHHNAAGSLETNTDSGAESYHAFCKDRFDTNYFEDFHQRRAHYCSDDSTTDMACFHSVSSGSFTAGSIDSFCVARHGIVFDTRKQKFVLDCRVRGLLSQEVSVGAIPLGDMNSYQYLTGPKYLLNEWLDLEIVDGPHEILPKGAGGPYGRDKLRGHNEKFVVLMKREVDGNIWHCLNEIMAIMITIDVLRMTPDKLSGEKPMLLPEDVEIVLLDEHPDGPFFDLFRMLSDKPPMRMAEWVSAQSNRAKGGGMELIAVDNIILPLPGFATPLWTDWRRMPSECDYNKWLQTYVQRMFDLYSIPRARVNQPPSAFRLNVTIIDRKGAPSRKLMGLDGHLFEALQTGWSEVADFRIVDFASMPFQEQIKIARDTDVMVGMHGAGLTQTMFMEEGRGALVEIQPDRLCFQGYRNLAMTTGHAYFVAGATKIVGNCYPRRNAGGEKGELEMLPDDGTALPSSWEVSRCWSYTTSPEDWSFVCSDPEITGGEQSYMTCQNRNSHDGWYATCTKKEAADMYWLTRYVMDQDKFLELVGDAIQLVREQRAQDRITT